MILNLQPNVVSFRRMSLGLSSESRLLSLSTWSCVGRWHSTLAKSAMAAPFFLVAIAGQLRPRGVYQTHFASSA